MIQKNNLPILLAMSIIPFTSLRFGLIGIAEILFLFILAYQLVSKKIIYSKYFFVSNFIGTYILIISISFSINVFITGDTNLIFSNWIFDLASYIFVFMMVYLLEFRLRNINRVGDFLWYFYCSWFAIFSILFFVSLGVDSVFGLPLRTYMLFTPLVENLHHTAPLFATLPFIGFYFFRERGRLIQKIIALLSIAMFILMAFESGSFKAVVGMAFGVIAIIFHAIFILTSSLKIRKISFFVSILLFSVVVTVFYFDEIYGFLLNLFNENDLHGGRAYIYMEALDKIYNSPILGYGPGAHIYDSSLDVFRDAHQTVLTVWLQGGLAALLLLLMFMFFLIKRSMINAYLFGAVCSLSIYILGGDILRRAPIWIMIITIVWLADSYRLSLKKVKQYDC
jgi:O-antigen ligase